MEDIETIVIDNGSYNIKAGFSGDDEPRSVFPTIIGKPKYSQVFDNGSYNYNNEVIYIYRSWGVRNINYPIKNGIITNWDDMEKIWEYTFYKELRIDPTEHPVLLTEQLFNPRPIREKITQIMFETFNVPSFFLAKAPILSLYATGRTTGVVVECGHDTTQILAINDGYSIPCSSAKYQIAGSDVSFELKKLLHNKYQFKTDSEHQILDDIKEKFCYVSQKLENDIKNPSEIQRSYELPDGNLIKIDKERVQATEILFQNNPNHDYPGISNSIINSINQCDDEYKQTLYDNIILSGGSTLFDGFADRIRNELNHSVKSRIIAAPHRKSAAWIGGSILASLTTFPQMAISKDSYEENGPSIISQAKLN